MANVAVAWSGKGSQMFVGRDSFGHTLVTGSWPADEAGQQEWKGIKPSDLLLLGLAACAGYDVVMILERQRQDISGLYIEADGNQDAEPPYAFTDIHLHYLLDGRDLDPGKVERAVQLSEERYCSVAATVRGVAKLSSSYEIR